MAGMIEFAPNFAEQSGAYVLLELPSELRNQLRKEQTLAIKEHNNESYIVGEDKLYQVIKYQISNLMLTSEVKEVPMSESHKYIVRSFQQSYLIPTVVRPFAREIAVYLRAITVEEGEPLNKPGLRVDFLKEKFVTNDRFLKKVLDDIGADIVEGYVINLSDDYKRLIFNTLMGKIVDRGLIASGDASFSVFTLKDLGIQASTEEGCLAMVILNHYFGGVTGEPDRFRFSLKGAVHMILTGIKKEVREFHYEDLIDLTMEALSMAVPKALLDSFGKHQIALDIEAGIKKHFLISDDEEFNQPVEKYMAKNVDAIMTEVDNFSENPMQR